MCRRHTAYRERGGDVTFTSSREPPLRRKELTKIRRNHLLAATIAVVCAYGGAFMAYAASSRPVAELPAIVELPNPFLFADGSTVDDPADWGRRREELREQFQQYKYGHLPPKPEGMRVTLGDVEVDEDVGATTQTMELHLTHAGRTLVMHARVVLPDGATEPVPVVVQGGLGRRRRRRDDDAPPPGPNDHLRQFVERGYGVAEFNLNEAAPDNKETARTEGVYALFGEDIDCGGLMAWAWGSTV